MDILEKISTEELLLNNKNSSLINTNNELKAVLTHYLQNINNLIPKAYKDEGPEILDLFIKNYVRIGGAPLERSDILEKLISEVENVPFPTLDSPTFNFIDLFAGIGGFRMALQNAGGKCIYSSEWNKAARLTYQKNFGEIPFGDITNDSVKAYIPKDFDILCAGFPCQAFSIAGYQKGFSDTRGTLFFDIEQIIEKHRPKVIFLENVKNLVSHDQGKTFKVILEILEKKLGYKVFTKVLNSMTHANIPQNRERIFIVGFDPNQVKNYHQFKFPEEIKLEKTIHDFIDSKKQNDKYYYPKSHPYYPELEKTMTNKDTIYQWRRVYVRENKNNVCPTLTANMGTGGHNVPLIKDDFGIRKLTPKECFSFQGYPVDRFILPPIANSRLYTQAGNSVTMPLVERISKEIVKLINEDDQIKI